jgi:hypothetical protein
MILTGKKPKDSEKNLSQFYFVHSILHMADLGANPGVRGGKLATNRLSYGAAIHAC